MYGINFSILHLKTLFPISQVEFYYLHISSEFCKYPLSPPLQQPQLPNPLSESFHFTHLTKSQLWLNPTLHYFCIHTPLTKHWGSKTYNHAQGCWWTSAVASPKQTSVFSKPVTFPLPTHFSTLLDHRFMLTPLSPNLQYFVSFTILTLR